MKIKVFKIRISENHLHQDEDDLNLFLSRHNVIKTETSFLNEEENFWSVLVFFDKENFEDKNHEALIKTPKFSVESESDLSIDEVKVFNALKHWRYEKSQELNLPPYMICSNIELMSVAKLKPFNSKDFFEIKGFGELKVNKFSEQILEVLMNV